MIAVSTHEASSNHITFNYKDVGFELKLKNILPHIPNLSM